MRIDYLLARLAEAHVGEPQDRIVPVPELEELYQLLRDYAACLEYVDALYLDRDPRDGSFQFTAFYWGEESLAVSYPLALMDGENTVEGFLRVITPQADRSLMRARLYGEIAPVGELQWRKG